MIIMVVVDRSRDTMSRKTSTSCLMRNWSSLEVDDETLSQSGQLSQHNKQESYAQRAQTSADPEDPDFGLWTPGSEA